jgi:dihydrodipicolinate synthase/N-acetylneuraminate lyase
MTAHAALAEWKGIFPSLPTAFDDEGELDLDGQRALARFAVTSGANGVLCFGLAGEVFRLTPGERRTLLEVISEEIAGRIPILAGVGAEATHTSLKLAREACAAGADAVVIPPPITTRLSREDLLRYFSDIAEAAQLPAMIQDAPEYLGVDLGPELVLEAARHSPHIRFAKLEAGADAIADWVERAEGVVSVFGGNAGLFVLDCLDHGAAGIAPGAEVTDFLASIYGHWCNDQHETAWSEFRKLLPILVYQSSQGIDHFNACAKYVLVRRGVLAGGHLRRPARALDEGSRRLLDRYLADLGVGDRDRVSQPV